MNAPTAQSTPYDITALPPVPYTPGYLAWAVAGGILILIVVYVTLSTRKKKAVLPTAFKSVHSELTKWAAKDADLIVLGRASTLIRTYLTTTLKQPIEGLSP